MASWLRSILAAFVAPPAPVVDFLRGLAFRRRALVDLDVAGFQGRHPGDAGLERLAVALERMGSDPQVRGLLLRLQDTQGSLAALQEVRAGIQRLVASGRPVLAHLVVPGNADLLLASAATRSWILPVGELHAAGLSVRLLFLGDALERLGIRVEVLSAGQFKSAAEPLTRSAPSPASRAALAALVDDLQDQYVQAVAEGRRLPEAVVREALAGVPLSAEEAVQRGLVDGAEYPDALPRLAEEALGFPPRRVRFGSWWRWTWLRGAHRRLAGRGLPVAVVHLEGTIVARGPRGGRRAMVDAARVGPLLERLREDRRVRGVLLVVDSRGGSAVASDLLGRAVARLREEKPVVALFRSAAASGGYYLSAGATRVLAQPATLTGSIGVLAVKPVAGEALARVGVHATALRGAPSADWGDPLRGLERGEQERLQESIRRFYDVFLAHVARGRALPVEDVRAVAEGRVWSGAMARERGLVDGFGTLRDALEETSRQAGVEAGPWDDPRWEIRGWQPSPLQRWLRNAMSARLAGPLERVLGTLVDPAVLEDAADLLQGAPEEVLAWEPYDLRVR